MAIEKSNAARLIRKRVHYEIIPSSVAQSIENPVALAIWCYLLTKPDDWVVRKSEIMRHFGLGKARYYAAIKYLKNAGLYTSDFAQLDNGKMSGRVITIFAEPKVPKTGKSVKPKVDKTAHLQRQRKIYIDQDILHKEPTEKKHLSLPQWINAESWADFEEHRKTIRKPLTELARKKSWNLLSGLTKDQQKSVIDYSIVGRYAGLFVDKIKGDSNAAHQQRNKKTQSKAEMFWGCIEPGLSVPWDEPEPADTGQNARTLD